MESATFDPSVVKCDRCGKTREVPQWPLNCSCGLRTYADGSTLSLRDHQLGDRVAIWLERLGVRKRLGCGCEERKRRLNLWGRRLFRCLWIVSAWLHPR